MTNRTNMYALIMQYIDDAIAHIETQTRGPSAYEIAVEEGFKGTKKEWLASLQGITPHVGSNGHWFFNTWDTGVVATPDTSTYYNVDNLIPLSRDDIDEICK